jgi:aminoglycoside phosphotransferase (APT) family kinase protein
MVMFAVPSSIIAIDAGWLSTALGAEVTDFAVTQLEGGVVSDIYRIDGLRYSEQDDTLPASIVVKVAAESADRRNVALSANLYGREIGFFRQLAAATPIRSPRVYAIADDGTARPERFAIVMEDLARHSTVFDQSDTTLGEEYARTLALEAARLHAHYWDSDAVQLPWLGRPDGRYRFPLDAVTRSCAGQLDLFREAWTTAYGEDLGRMEQFADGLQVAELVCSPACDLIHERIYDVLSSRPWTILHGDLRADNIFGPDPMKPGFDQDGRLTFIDWQLIHPGPPGPDLTEAWVLSLEPDVRRRELELLRDYHEALVALNSAARSYTYEMLVEDYTLACCLWLAIVIAVGVGMMPTFAQPEAARMKRLWHHMTTRALTAVGDLQCRALLDTLLGQAS